MKFNKRATVESLLVRLEVLQTHTNNIRAACAHLQARGHREAIECGDLQNLLHEEECETWKNLFMWAMTLSDADRDRIKCLAHDVFLKEHVSVVEIWQDTGSFGAYLAADDDAFREMARKAFAPREEEGTE